MITQKYFDENTRLFCHDAIIASEQMKRQMKYIRDFREVSQSAEHTSILFHMSVLACGKILRESHLMYDNLENKFKYFCLEYDFIRYGYAVLTEKETGEEFLIYPPVEWQDEIKDFLTEFGMLYPPKDSFDDERIFTVKSYDDERIFTVGS